MDHYTTARGTVRVGQLYRDARRTNVRTLRVEAIGRPWNDWKGVTHCSIDCLVIEQVADGVRTEPRRPTSMRATRLLSAEFVLVEEVS
ncbi:hypothetical protein ACQPXH_33105 (plasmid) [Nocardia sp. CA-135953]|uniref:hypothetical protein n=1 Tax=Nocardia sp. CA-135953 TaxID=3239978 RepID=UPI003D95348B